MKENGRISKSKIIANIVVTVIPTLKMVGVIYLLTMLVIG